LPVVLTIVDTVFVVAQLVSITGNSSSVDIWRLTAAVMTSRGAPAARDRLTSPISDVIVTSDDRLAFASAAGGDEVGVYDMTSGRLVDLMTHEGPVACLAVTSSGAHLFVALRHARLGRFNKVRALRSRCYKLATSYRPERGGETICSPPMAVGLAADLRPSADGYAVRTWLSCRQPLCL